MTNEVKEQFFQEVRDDASTEDVQLFVIQAKDLDQSELADEEF